MRRASRLCLCLGGLAVDGVRVGEDLGKVIIGLLILTNTQEESMSGDLSVAVEDTLDFMGKSRVWLTGWMVDVHSAYILNFYA